MELMVAQEDPRSKDRWREAMVAELSALSPGVKMEESRSLSKELGRWVENQGFEVVLATIPFPDEPDLTSFLSHWLSQGRLALARTGPQKSLSFRYVNDLEGPWERKKWGLQEPPSHGVAWEPGPKTLCLIPGLAFASREDRIVRLGRGGGYYDRWLDLFGSQIVSRGYGFSIQFVKQLPLEPHDRLLDGWQGPFPARA